MKALWRAALMRPIAKANVKLFTVNMLKNWYGRVMPIMLLIPPKNWIKTVKKSLIFNTGRFTAMGCAIRFH
ncbi:hypothetical protein GALL_540850 [mine drainage metagenome]|uniref:Uncharacterized protein n=1 Tax=mine drainage metagenome TaxID=410659 RepID=A0A1J5PA56_9ZZZZ